MTKRWKSFIAIPLIALGLSASALPAQAAISNGSAPPWSQVPPPSPTPPTGPGIFTGQATSLGKDFTLHLAQQYAVSEAIRNGYSGQCIEIWRKAHFLGPTGISDRWEALSSVQCVKN